MPTPVSKKNSAAATPLADPSSMSTMDLSHLHNRNASFRTSTPAASHLRGLSPPTIPRSLPISRSLQLPPPPVTVSSVDSEADCSIIAEKGTPLVHWGNMFTRNQLKMTLMLLLESTRSETDTTPLKLAVNRARSSSKTESSIRAEPRVPGSLLMDVTRNIKVVDSTDISVDAEKTLTDEDDDVEKTNLDGPKVKVPAPVPAKPQTHPQHLALYPTLRRELIVATVLSHFTTSDELQLFVDAVYDHNGSIFDDLFALRTPLSGRGNGFGTRNKRGKFGNTNRGRKVGCKAQGRKTRGGESSETSSLSTKTGSSSLSTKTQATSEDLDSKLLQLAADIEADLSVHDEPKPKPEMEGEEGSDDSDFHLKLTLDDVDVSSISFMISEGTYE